MADQTDTEVILLLSILQEPNADKARRRYLETFGLDEIDDQTVYEAIEAKVCDAVMRKESIVEIEREIAQTMLLLLKRGIKKSKGGQRGTRAQRMSKRTLVELGGRIKKKLAKGGMSATEAHLQAADDAAEEAAQHGLKFSANYLARAMDKAKQ
jgi:hypothetical protein